MKYIYESYMGGIYTNDWELSYDELYCETCGDSDIYIGAAETRAEARALLEDEYDCDSDEIKAFINENWEE